MRVIFSTGPVSPALTDTVAAIGIFDGVHTGHQSLISQMVKSARRKKMKSLVITFHPHPVEVLQNKAFNYLVSLEHRIALIDKLGVDIVVVIKFNKTFSHLKPEAFVGKYLVGSLGVKEVFVGDDFRFGENRTGDVDLFESMGRRYGFTVRHIDPIKKTKLKISSSWLRNLIDSGELQAASKMLGRKVSVCGRVIRGDGIGKKIGFPTANIKVTSGILPSNGVYIISVNLEGHSIPGVCNIGCRPTIKGESSIVRLEVHLLDTNKNIYAKELQVEFLHKIRNERKFPSVDLLVKQIQDDVKHTRRYFKKLK